MREILLAQTGKAKDTLISHSPCRSLDFVRIFFSLGQVPKAYSSLFCELVSDLLRLVYADYKGFDVLAGQRQLYQDQLSLSEDPVPAMPLLNKSSCIFFTILP